MPDIDQLSIQIEASSQNAQDAVTGLISSLENLNKQLGLKNGTKLTTILDTLAKSMSTISGVANGISGQGFEQVAKGAQKASDSVGKTLEKVERLNDQLALPQKIGYDSATRKAFEADLRQTLDTKNLTKNEPVLALPQFEKMLPVISQTQSAIDGLYGSIKNVVNEQPKIDAVTQSFNDWKSQNQTLALPMFEKMLPAVVQTQAATKDLFKTLDDAVNDGVKLDAVTQAFLDWKSGSAEATSAIKGAETTALALADQFKNVDLAAKKAYESVHKVTEKTPSGKSAFDGIEQEAQKAKSAIEEAIEKAREFKKVISDMESGKVPFDKQMFDDAVMGYEKATKAVKDYKDALTGKGEKATKSKSHSEMADIVEQSVELGEALEKLAQRFEMVAEKGVSLFKLLTAPFRAFASEYVEKFEHMKDTVANFQKNFKAHMKKVSDFWKRTMKTFTFMLVRKAITAIIKEVGNAIQSLAMYSNAMGTAFNTDISNMVADFQYLGRSIVSVFAPLLNYIVPIIDAIVDRIATLLSYIGMLFAALGGSASFTKAKKNVSNYAESLDQASKSAKNLTMGIDELNILSENSGGGSAKPFDGFEDAWEEVDIPQWLQDLSDLFKKFWEKFTNPFKEAWDRAKQYLIDGFKTMIDSLKRMFGHILDDFLEVLNQEKTIRMFEQILRIVGDLMRVVRNLADQFDKAWQKGKVGLKIFENLRDIMAILVDHARNVSYYMIGWAKEINFSPLLEALEELTRKLKPLADFIGGVFEDIMINGVLKYIEFMIEDAIPHLMETISKIVDAFNFNTLRDRLKPVWTAFEELFENIHTGMTNAFGNLGVEFARFVDSDEFAKFLERIAEVTKVITAQRVEKVLTGLGKGILNIAKAVVKFVNSDAFMKFINAIGEWIDKKSTKEIAGVLEKLAAVILTFKFGAFAASKLAGFFEFFTVITALKNLKTIASHFNLLSNNITKLGKATSTLKITSFAQGFKTLGENIYLLPTKVGELGAKFLDLHNHLGLVTKSLGSLFVGFEEFKHVEKYVGDLSYSLMSGDGLNGSLLKLIATVGIAGTAFTALLGFPAGIIATGVVAAVGAIKGIQDAVDQLNFDVLNEAIITGGDTTLAQAKEWYEQATALVSEQTQKWTDDSRNLTQSNADIQAYMQTISEMSGVLNTSKEATVLMVDQLTSKYKDLDSAITNYIDESTNSLVANLLAQKSYLEAQGFDVDQMILDIYRTAEETKNAVSEATKGVEEAAKKYSEAVKEHGYDSKEAEAALKEYYKATDQAEQATGKLSQALQEVTTDEAVEEIKALGESLDLSEFAGDPEGAITALEGNIDDLKAAYLAKMQDLKTARDNEIKAVRENTLYNDEQKAAEIAGINNTFAEMSDTLATETGKVFDLYQRTIATKVEEVGKNASEKWEEAGGKIFGYDTKAEYVHEQVKNFVDKMLGEEGMEGTINKFYEEMPGNVNNNIVTAMDNIVAENWDAYHSAMDGVYTQEKANQYDYYQGILDSANDLDYDTPASTFATTSWNTIMSYARGTNFDEYGKVVIGGAAKSITDSKQEFEDAMRVVSGEGANAFSDEHKKELEPLAEAMKGIGLESGENFDLSFIDSIRNTDVAKQLEEETKTWGLGLTTGVNTGIEENAESTKPFIYDWFKQINDFIHDNPFMPFGSPNKKTHEYGEDIVLGFAEGVEAEKNKGTLNRSIIMLFTEVGRVMREQMDTIKTSFQTKLVDMFNPSGIDVTSPITKIFATIKTAITNEINVFGNELFSSILPEFMNMYIFPFFNVDMWQPFFDNLLNMVFIPFFETFKTWFMEEAMTPWWNEELLFWFTNDKWDEEIFDPLRENIQEHWESFIEWWDTSMTDWWEVYVIKWFEKDLWKEQFEHVHDAAKEVFELVKEAIKKRIEQAQQAVVDACNVMMEAIGEVIKAIGEMMDALKGFEGFEGKVTFDFGGKTFASGGFPAYGSLFVAGEPGAGTEWVGNINGKTGVVSNDEITGIANAVYATGSTESQLLTQLISIGRAMLDKDPIVLGDRDIARMANAGQSKLGMSIIT